MISQTAAAAAYPNSDRLEAVAGMINRRATDPVEDGALDVVEEGTRLSLHIRAANLDEDVVGHHPQRLDPDRARRLKVNGA